MTNKNKNKNEIGAGKAYTRKLAGTGVAIGLLLVVIASIAFEYISHGIIDKTENQLQAIAKSQQLQLSRFIWERQQDGNILSQRTAVQKTLASKSGSPAQASYRAELKKTLEQTAKVYQYNDVRLIDSSMRSLMAVKDDPIQPIEIEAFKKTIKERRAQIVDAHMSLNGVPCFGVTHPVFNRNDPTKALIGLVYLETNMLKDFSALFAADSEGSASLESILFRILEGRIEFLTKLRFQPDAIPLKVSIAADPKLATTLGTATKPVVKGARDYRGIDVLAAIEPVSGIRWFLAVKMDKAEIESPLHQLGIVIALITTLLLLIMVYVFRQLWRIRAAEQKIIQSGLQTRIASASETSLDGYIMFDDKARIIDVNPALCRMTGYPRDVLLDKTLWHLGARRNEVALLTKLDELRKAGGARFQTRLSGKNGLIIDVEVSAIYVALPDGGYFQAFLHDIGPHLRDRRRLERLDEFHAFLSHANAGIFNSPTIHTALDRLCKAAVEDGRFVLVWAAFLDPHSDRIVPEIIHGPAAGYAQGLDMSLQPDHPDGNGPSARSVRERRIVYVDDFQKDVRTRYWMDRAREYGIRSSASVPIVVSDQVVAAVAFYSDEPDHFTPQLQGLLEEASKNVALAWQAILSNQEKRTAQDAQAVSEKRFQRIFDASPLPTQIFSLSTRELKGINRAHEVLFGYTPAEIATESVWFERVYPDAEIRNRIRGFWEKSLDEASAENTPIAQQAPEILALRCKNGEERRLNGFMSLVGDDVIVQWQDVTEIITARERFAENEKQFRGMIEQTINGIYVVQDERVVYANPRLQEILGWSEEELVGGNPFDFVDPGDIEQAKSFVMRIKSGTGSAADTLRVVRKDRQMVDLSVYAVASEWKLRPATLIFATDITERKRAEEAIASYVKRLEAMMHGTLEAVSRMVEMRDPYTAGHQRRVGLVAAAIGKELGWSEDRCRNMELIGLVHDIGKISVPAELLSKPTRLTSLEYKIIRSHAENGYLILKDVDFPLPIADIIRAHHERMDGSGYPQGLKGEEISIEARVLAVADVFESMANDRPYRPAVGAEAAIGELDQHRGTWFDPLVVDALMRLVRDKGYRLPS